MRSTRAPLYTWTAVASEFVPLCEDQALENPLFPTEATATRILVLNAPARPNSSGEPSTSDLETALKALEWFPDEQQASSLVQVVTSRCTISEWNEARALGERLQADIVVWPYISPDGMTTQNIMRIALLSRNITLREEGNSRWLWGELSELEIPIGNLSAADWLGQALIGLHYYRVQDPLKATRRFDLAIQHALAAQMTNEVYSLNVLLGINQYLSSSTLAAQAALRLAEEQARAIKEVRWEAHALRIQADIHTARGDFGEGRRKYDEALGRYRSLSDKLGEADCFVGMAELSVQLSDLPEARRLYRAAVQSFHNLQRFDREALALKGAGDVSFWMCDYVDATFCYSSALSLYSTLKLSAGTAMVQQRLGDIRLWQANYAGAEQLFRDSLALHQQNRDATREAGLIMSLGDLRKITSDFPGAREFYTQALQIYQQSADGLGQANAARSLGEILSIGTSYDDARFYLEQAMELYRRNGSPQGEASCLRGLAWLERSFGVGYARRQYEAALSLSHRSGDKIGEAHARIGLGQLGISREDYVEAKENFDRARRLFHEAGYLLGEARSLQGLTESSWGLMDPSAAEVFFNEAARVFRDAGLKQGELQLYLSYGQAAMRANALPVAYGAFSSAIDQARALNDRKSEADATLLMSRLHIREGRSMEGSRELEKVRDIYRQLGAVRNLAIASADLGTVLLTLGESQKGKSLLEEASALFDQIGMNGEADSCRSLIVAPPVEGQVGIR